LLQSHCYWQLIIAGAVVTGNKLIASVTELMKIRNTRGIDTSEQLIAGVIDTSNKHKVENISQNFRKNLK
jgi:hypothetical protein